MKNTILAIILLGIVNSFSAQIQVWQGVDLGRLGYRHNLFTFNTTVYEPRQLVDNNTSAQMINYTGPSETIKLSSLDFSFEVYGKNAYVFFDGSMIPNLIQGLAFKKKLEEKTKLPSGAVFDIAEFIPTRLAFGGMFAKYFGIYVGGQYMYSVVLTDKIDQIGGNQRGVGGHFLAGSSLFLFRYSYMYDWIRREKKQFKGIATTHEFSLHVPFGDAGAGIVARTGFRVRKMDAIYGNISADSPLPEYKPSFQAFDRYITIGLYAEGLFSGLSRTTSKAAGGLYGG
jgi:hypothetical protein